MNPGDASRVERSKRICPGTGSLPVRCSVEHVPQRGPSRPASVVVSAQHRNEPGEQDDNRSGQRNHGQRDQGEKELQKLGVHDLAASQQSAAQPWIRPQFPGDGKGEQSSAMTARVIEPRSLPTRSRHRRAEPHAPG